MKYEIGDKVIVKTGTHYAITKKGAVGIVEKYIPYCDSIIINFYGCPICVKNVIDDDLTFEINIDDIELVVDNRQNLEELIS